MWRDTKMIKYDFEDFLAEKFVALLEIDGRSITKDNYEDMFDNWLSQLDGDEYIHYADLFAIDFASKQLAEVQKNILQITQKP